MFRPLVLSLLLFAVTPVHAQLKVFACEAEWGALAEQLGGDKLDVYHATTGKQDVHQIQARPSLLARAGQAALLVCTGAELESGWLPILLSKTGNPAIQPGRPGHFMAADFVELKDPPTQLDRSLGDIHAAGNPHIQTDPRNIARVADALSLRLQQLDPAHAEFYQARQRDFAQRWQDALRDWERRAAPLRGMPLVVYHDGWGYLEDWLGLDKIAVLEPKPGVPPGSGHLSALLRQLQQQPAKAVVYASYQDPRAAEWLSSRAGIPALELPASVGGNEAATDLFGLFEDILQRLLVLAQ